MHQPGAVRMQLNSWKLSCSCGQQIAAIAFYLSMKVRCGQESVRMLERNQINPWNPLQHILTYGCVWKCCVPNCTQWFCWSLSLKKNGYFIGNINPTFSDKPIFQVCQLIAPKAATEITEAVFGELQLRCVLVARRTSPCAAVEPLFKLLLWVLQDFQSEKIEASTNCLHDIGN